MTEVEDPFTSTLPFSFDNTAAINDKFGADPRLPSEIDQIFKSSKKAGRSRNNANSKKKKSLDLEEKVVSSGANYQGIEEAVNRRLARKQKEKKVTPKRRGKAEAKIEPDEEMPIEIDDKLPLEPEPVQTEKPTVEVNVPELEPEAKVKPKPEPKPLGEPAKAVKRSRMMTSWDPKDDLDGPSRKKRNIVKEQVEKREAVVKKAAEQIAEAKRALDEAKRINMVDAAAAAKTQDMLKQTAAALQTEIAKVNDAKAEIEAKLKQSEEQVEVLRVHETKNQAEIQELQHRLQQSEQRHKAAQQQAMEENARIMTLLNGSRREEAQKVEELKESLKKRQSELVDEFQKLKQKSGHDKATFDKEKLHLQTEINKLRQEAQEALRAQQQRVAAADQAIEAQKTAHQQQMAAMKAHYEEQVKKVEQTQAQALAAIAKQAQEHKQHQARLEAEVKALKANTLKMPEMDPRVTAELSKMTQVLSELTNSIGHQLSAIGSSVAGATQPPNQPPSGSVPEHMIAELKKSNNDNNALLGQILEALNANTRAIENARMSNAAVAPPAPQVRVNVDNNGVIDAIRQSANNMETHMNMALETSTDNLGKYLGKQLKTGRDIAVAANEQVVRALKEVVDAIKEQKDELALIAQAAGEGDDRKDDDARARAIIDAVEQLPQRIVAVLPRPVQQVVAAAAQPVEDVEAANARTQAIIEAIAAIPNQLAAMLPAIVHNAANIVVNPPVVNVAAPVVNVAPTDLNPVREAIDAALGRFAVEMRGVAGAMGALAAREVRREGAAPDMGIWRDIYDVAGQQLRILNSIRTEIVSLTRRLAEARDPGERAEILRATTSVKLQAEELKNPEVAALVALAEKEKEKQAEALRRASAGFSRFKGVPDPLSGVLTDQAAVDALFNSMERYVSAGQLRPDLPFDGPSKARMDLFRLESNPLGRLNDSTELDTELAREYPKTRLKPENVAQMRTAAMIDQALGLSATRDQNKWHSKDSDVLGMGFNNTKAPKIDFLPNNFWANTGTVDGKAPLSSELAQAMLFS